MGPLLCLILSGTLAGPIGQLSEWAYHRLPQFIDAGTRRAGIESLATECEVESDLEPSPETRLWLLGERGAVYLLRILGPTLAGKYDGEFYVFDGPSIDRLHHRRIYDWAAVAASLSNREKAEPNVIERGRLTFLSLVVQSCRDGEYRSETFWDLADLSDEEQRSAFFVRGLIMLLDVPQGSFVELDPAGDP